MIQGIEDECARILRQFDFIDEKHCEMIPRLIRKKAVAIERMKIKQREKFFLSTSALSVESIPDPPESASDTPPRFRALIYVELPSGTRGLLGSSFCSAQPQSPKAGERVYTQDY